MAISGCASPDTSLAITNYRGGGVVEFLCEPFQEAYYDRDDQGNVSIVMRTESAVTEDDDRRVVQMVSLRTFWNSVPGRTVAQRTQLNATVKYCIISPAVVACFDGAGSLFAKGQGKGDVLLGTLELARLSPGVVISGDDRVFDRSELSGTFRATKDSRRVVGIMNELDRTFGHK